MAAPNSSEGPPPASGLGVKISLLTGLALILGICLVTTVGVIQEYRWIRASFIKNAERSAALVAH